MSKWIIAVGRIRIGKLIGGRRWPEESAGVGGRLAYRFLFFFLQFPLFSVRLFVSCLRLGTLDVPFCIRHGK